MSVPNWWQAVLRVGGRVGSRSPTGAPDHGPELYGARESVSANHQFGDAAQAARILPPLESVRSGKLARLVIGVLTDGQPQLFGDAVVADRLGREPGNKPLDIIKYRHRSPLLPSVGRSRHGGNHKQIPRARARQGEGARPDLRVRAQIGRAAWCRPAFIDQAARRSASPSSPGSGRAMTAPGAPGSGSSSLGRSRSISRAACALAWAATVPTPPRAV